ncbi:MAG TPA: CaiB/BaiF CoA-transferase family protein [Steroidobacteraceae bacterium]|nr:CaiB/BaiF CoA-transferase family protein [Steroidobacteraceae bacterium]
MSGALSHIKVLDLSRILAGPMATQNLADLGATVIKVERPKVGDDTRRWGPPFLKDADGNATFDSSYYLSANRGKKSITLDFTHPTGQDIIRRLAAQVDILVENYMVGNLAKYGLAYDDLKDANPRLIYCSITGFGQNGPYAHLPGYDFVFQGMGGLMSITGNPEDQPGGEPMKVGIAIADILTGMYATTAMLAALEHRRVTGRGQHIDLALLDAVVALNSYQALNYFISGRLPQRLGNAHPNMVPYQVFKCRDGNIILAVGNDGQFQRFAQAVGHGEWASDSRYATNPDRIRNRESLVEAISRVLLTYEMSPLVQLLESVQVACGPINEMDRVFDDPQVRHRGMKISLPHGCGVMAPNVASPMRFSDSVVTYRHAAPMLGEHTAEVLMSELGLSAEEILELRNNAVC